VSSFVSRGATIGVVVERSRSGVRVAVDGGSSVDVAVVAASSDAVEFELVGRRHRVRLHAVTDTAGRVIHADSAAGSSALTVVPRFAVPEAHIAAGSLLAPMPGTAVSVGVVVGDAVAAGQTLITIEAMKMEHPVRTPVAGTVSQVRVAPGDQVRTGEVLVVVVPDPAPGTE
jgi:propionyl-CoA carboxylase alpha chain